MNDETKTETEAKPQNAVGSSDWLDALEKAWKALAALRQHREHRDDPMLMIDADRMLALLDQRIEVESASNEKLSRCEQEPCGAARKD
jgi:hypothetical protein